MASSPIPSTERTGEALVVIAGPTASGKSALALDVAEAFGGWIINADSMQVYRQLRVLTARPTPAEEARAPHRLFGHVSIGEPYSVGRWLAEAQAAIAEARAARALPVVVGGSGLYLKALAEGLAPVPAIPAAVRGEALALHAELGPAAFRERLAVIDPAMAAALPAGDRQRLLRAYEVMRATGRSLADWQAGHAAGPPVAGRRASLVLLPPRESLYAAIDARFRRMLATGALEEVRALAADGYRHDLPAMKAVGVPALVHHLAGEIGLAEAEARASRASRNYAKRQITWIRHQMADATVFDTQYSESLKPKIFSFIRHFLLTEPA